VSCSMGGGAGRASVGIALIVAAAACGHGSPSASAPTAAAGASHPAGPQASTVPALTATSLVGSTARARVSPTIVAGVGTPGLFVVTDRDVAPASVSVAPGRMVTWLNSGSLAHRIVSDEPGLFDTGSFGPNEFASVTVSTPGFHDWRDPTTPAITGTIRVIP
jgi:plastocyanin